MPGAAAVKNRSGDVTLEAVLQVVSPGLWTPANSNGFQSALLLQLHFQRDDTPEPLQDLVHTATIVSAVPRGPAARRLLNQVYPMLRSCYYSSTADFRAHRLEVPLVA